MSPAEWPSGLGKGLQSPVRGFDSRLRLGRLAQWESASLTRKRSLVQSQYRPPRPLISVMAGQGPFWCRGQQRRTAPHPLAAMTSPDDDFWMTRLLRRLLAVLASGVLLAGTVVLPGRCRRPVSAVSRYPIGSIAPGAWTTVRACR